MEKNYFVELNAVNVNDKTEKKNGLTYLSWAWAWGEVKKRHPDATYTVYEREDGTIYWTDGKTCWVKTGLTINGLEHIEYLPVMDYKNRSIPLEAVTSMDVNKAIQRSLTKAAARHGLGLYIYAGEDLPEDENATPEPAPEKKPAPKGKTPPAPKQEKTEPFVCERCGKAIGMAKNDRGEMKNPQDQVAFSRKAFGRDYCLDCSKIEYAAARKAAMQSKLNEEDENAQ